MTETLKQITLKQIIERQEEIKVRTAELDAMIKSFEEQEEAKANFPRKGDIYYYIDEDGDIMFEEYDGSVFDIDVFANGNGYPTEEKAEFEREFRKVKYEMEKCGGVFSDKLNRDEWFMLKRGEGAVVIDVTVTRWTVPNMWFPDHKSAHKAIETIGDERLLKYWFNEGVQE